MHRRLAGRLCVATHAATVDKRVVMELAQVRPNFYRLPTIWPSCFHSSASTMHYVCRLQRDTEFPKLMYYCLEGRLRVATHAVTVDRLAVMEFVQVRLNFYHLTTIWPSHLHSSAGAMHYVCLLWMDIEFPKLMYYCLAGRLRVATHAVTVDRPAVVEFVPVRPSLWDIPHYLTTSFHSSAAAMYYVCLL